MITTTHTDLSTDYTRHSLHYQLLPHREDVVPVAVGVIRQQDQVLLAWRNARQHQGDRYEFPGGKVDAGESPAQALVRELQEELGIEVTHFRPMQRLTFHYPEKTVCLYVFLVEGFSGEPEGQEGQALSWVSMEELPLLRFPDANAAIVRAVSLPWIYRISPAVTLPASDSRTISDSKTITDSDPRHQWEPKFHQSVETVCKTLPEHSVVYLRQPEWPVELVPIVVPGIQQHRPDLSLGISLSWWHALQHSPAFNPNSYLNSDLKSEQTCGQNTDKNNDQNTDANTVLTPRKPITSIHLSHSTLMMQSPASMAQLRTELASAGNSQCWIVASVHDETSIQQANALGVDAVFLGNVQATPTHPGKLGLGWSAFARLAASAECPVYALGGMSEATLDTAQQHGAWGIAGIRLAD